MNCMDIRRYVHLFLDDELDVEKNLSFLEHINACSTCAERLESEKAFRNRLEESLESVPVRAGFREELFARLDEEAADESPEKAKVLFNLLSSRVLRVAAAILILVLGFWLPGQWIGKESVRFEALAQDAVDLHSRLVDGREKLDLVTDRTKAVQEHVSGQSFFTCVPDLRGCPVGRAEVHGARLGTLADSVPYSLVLYRREEAGWIAHIDAPEEKIDFSLAREVEWKDRTLYVFTRGDTHFVGLRGGGIFCGFICGGDLTEEQAIAVATGYFSKHV